MKANNYKQMASASRTAEEVFEVTVPSGFVWKLREPPIQAFVLAGRLPATLTAKMANLHERYAGDVDGATQACLEELDAGELLTNLIFARDLLLHSAVEPKIMINPGPDDDAIAPEDILPKDLEFLLGWVMGGGKSGESLGTFRPE